MLNWVQARNAKEFVHQILVERDSRLNQTELSRRCGFSSRSTLSQLLSGKRQFQFASASKLIEALELNEVQRQYFWNLIELENPEIKGKARETSQIEKDLRSIRQNLNVESKQRKHLKTIPANIRNVLMRPNFPCVYAATGDGKKPATLAEICKRSGLKSNTVKEELDFLVEADLVSWNSEDKTYLAKEFHLDITQQGFSGYIQQQLQNNLKQAQQSALKDFSSQEALFYSGYTLVKKKDLPALKKELRSLMLKFIDDNYDGDGDQVQAITLSFFKP
ncbi:MAG: DUF4423 domain-containing protein [Bdellovibrionota bacterium]